MKSKFKKKFNIISQLKEMQNYFTEDNLLLEHGGSVENKIIFMD